MSKPFVFPPAPRRLTRHPRVEFRGLSFAATLALSLAVAAGVLHASEPVRAAVVQWTGKAGTPVWTDAANWNTGTLPGNNDEVVIPPRSGVIEIRQGNPTVQRINAPDGLRVIGGVLTLTDGVSRIGGTFVVEERATLVVRGAKTVVTGEGSGVVWTGNLQVYGGAQVELGQVATIRAGSISWLAQDDGSAITLPALKEVVLPSNGYFAIRATGGSRVDLSSLTAIRGPMQLDAGNGALIDLSGLRGSWSSEGFSYRQTLRATGGGVIRAGGISAYERGDLELDSPEALNTRQITSLRGGSLTVRGGKPPLGLLETFDDSDLAVYNGAVVALPRLTSLRLAAATWRARDPGSRIEANAITNLVFTTAGYLTLHAETDGVIDLSAVPRLIGPIQANASGGGLIDLNGAKGLWTTQGFSYRQSLTTRNFGRILIPGITEFDRGTIDLESADGLTTKQIASLTRSALTLRRVTGAFEAIQSIDDTDITLRDGAVLRFPAMTTLKSSAATWRVDGPGSLLDLSALRDLALPSNGYLQIYGTTDARIDLSSVGSIRGPLQASATGRAIIDLSGLKGRWTSEGFSYRQSLTASEGGRILVPGLTEFDRGTLDLDGALTITTRGLTSLTRSGVTVRQANAQFDSLLNVDDTDFTALGGAEIRVPGVQRLQISGLTWRAQGPGSRINAASIRDLVFTRSGYFDVQASIAGHIDLSGVTAIDGPLRVNAFSGGTVDLSGLRGRWSSDGFSYQQALTASSEGRILIPGITEFDRGQISLTGPAEITTDQFRALTRSTVLVDNARLPLGRLSQQDGTTFTLRNGGTTAFGDLPRIVTHPVDARIQIGTTHELRVVADGAPPLAYQWRKNGQVLRGERAANLVLDNLTISNAGIYTVVVGNAAGFVESLPAEVTVALPAFPWGDNLNQAGRIVNPSGLGAGNSDRMTREAGEPRHAGKRGGRSFWLTWRAPDSGRAIFSTAGSNFDTLLAVYLGDSITSLREIASDDDSGGFLTSHVEFDAEIGTDYRIVVDGFAEASGEVILSWDLARGISGLPRIVETAESTAVIQGGNVVLSVQAEGNGLNYQWLFNGEPIPGANAPDFTLPTIDGNRAGLYSVRVTAANGASTESRPARVEVTTSANAAPAQDKLDDLFPELAATSPALHAGGGTAVNAVFPGIPGSRETGNQGAERSPEDPIVLGELGGASIWLRFQATADGWMLLSTEGSSIPTVLGVYTNREALEPIAMALPVAPATHSEVLFGAFAGQDYLVMIDGVDGATGPIQLSYSLDLAIADAPRSGFITGGFLIQVPVSPDRYELAIGDDPALLTPLLTTNVVNGMFQYLDPDAPARARRFYRINTAP